MSSVCSANEAAPADTSARTAASARRAQAHHLIAQRRARHVPTEPSQDAFEPVQRQMIEPLRDDDMGEAGRPRPCRVESAPAATALAPPGCPAPGARSVGRRRSAARSRGQRDRPGDNRAARTRRRRCERASSPQHGQAFSASVRSSTSCCRGKSVGRCDSGGDAGRRPLPVSCSAVRAVLRLGLGEAIEECRAFEPFGTPAEGHPHQVVNVGLLLVDERT